MDNKVKILLGSEKNINGVNIDNYNKVELIKKENRLTEFNVNDVVNTSELFDNERENNSIYRIYGRIEYLSLLNGLKTNYSELKDFFNPQKTGNFKNIFNSFDFYLVAPTAKASYDNITNTNNYKRSFEVIADKYDFELYDAGFNNNVFDEQTYIFNFKSDFDVNNLYDSFGFPITELFLYIQYKKDSTQNEEMSFITWSTSTGNKIQTSLNINSFNIGDIVKTVNGFYINDIITYDKNNFFQEQFDKQKFYIRTKYDNNKILEWTYNPFIPFKLRYFDGVLSTGKLSNIVENSTTLNIFNINETGTTINLSKSLKQNLSEITRTISAWDDETNTNFDFNAETGVLKFLDSGTYKINFKTKIYLSEETDKYIAQIYLEEKIGSTWTEITGTTRKFYENNSIEGIILKKDFSSGNYLRVRVGLIPNPDERKLKLIPDYATIIEDSGKYVWRDIVRQGYTEPIFNNGVNYPFFNGKRYLFQPIVFSVIPNLSTEDFEKDTNTINVFSEISYSDDATIINKTPTTNLDNIGKPCQ